ncbi:MAG: polysaccharide biosynthesis/export family protein [Ideonella sp.]|nr:polysaccharide biosynthesis/export family protein [Ideonella sp.]
MTAMKNRLIIALALAGSLCAAVQAQTPAPQTATGPATNTAAPQQASVQASPAPAPASSGFMAPGPLPAQPHTGAGLPVMFGSQMFTGRFGSVTFSGFNPNYTLATGDRVLVRLWGAVTHESTQLVDPQGNIFIPNVGPVKVAGVRNGELNVSVEATIKRVFRANVGVYATLEAAQPVKVYVTGFVRAPGLYGGLSSDSVLYYLDKAGGIDTERGSYLSVDVMRNGKLRTRLNLYNFLLKGQIEQMQLHDGDTIVIAARKHTVTVQGEAQNAYRFELAEPRIAASELLAMAAPTPNATHINIVRSIGPEKRSEYHPLAKAQDVMVEAGDEVLLTADKFPSTIQVRIDGAHQGERTFILPYGARLKDVIERLNPAPQANLDALQLFRRSVAQRQKENLDATLRGLEAAALTGRSATNEEATLRRSESEMILQFIERAKTIVPKGQVVLSSKEAAAETLMEDGDVVRLPERSNVVAVSGEVLFPNTMVYTPNVAATDYVEMVGGFTQRADRNKLLILKPNGTIDTSGGTPSPGDEIMVFPKVETKWVEVARGITTVLYQMAIAAGVLNGTK